MHGDIYTDIYRARETGWQGGRGAESEGVRQRVTQIQLYIQAHTYTHTYILPVRHTGRHTGRHIDRQSGGIHANTTAGTHTVRQA